MSYKTLTVTKKENPVDNYLFRYKRAVGNWELNVLIL